MKKPFFPRLSKEVYEELAAFSAFSKIPLKIFIHIAIEAAVHRRRLQGNLRRVQKVQGKKRQRSVEVVKVEAFVEDTSWETLKDISYTDEIPIVDFVEGAILDAIDFFSTEMGRGMLVLTKPPKLSVMLRKKEDKEWAYGVLRRWKGEIEKGF